MNNLTVSKAIIAGREKSGKLIPCSDGNEKYYTMEQLKSFEIFKQFNGNNWYEEQKIKPIRPYSSIELFAGAEGLALGLE